MIKLIRVDYRLIHGQVAVSWTASLGADAILLVSDTLQNDTIRKETLLLAKPSNVKLVAKDTQGAIDILKSGKTDHYKVFVVCETLEIADKVARAVGEKKINLGNIAFEEGKKKLDRSIYVDENDSELIKSLSSDGFDVFLQMVPSDKKLEAVKLI